ncbi:hypothetical protein MIND_01245200 [Mycena indigotica]|uniref:Uncharacterized protein n=1 Tax=Mycena indigotica TaxID=2126181 RepID=A0A8H6VXV6_9AGAR|nr:uncharacterized protein MIND_01245200 [Mycena indigotica]KAF7292179.1 hypothetical protein MIND_01245200 [Mycena indigotica]
MPDPYQCFFFINHHHHHSAWTPLRRASHGHTKRRAELKACACSRAPHQPRAPHSAPELSARCWPPPWLARRTVQRAGSNSRLASAGDARDRCLLRRLRRASAARSAPHRQLEMHSRSSGSFFAKTRPLTGAESASALAVSRARSDLRSWATNTQGRAVAASLCCELAQQAGVGLLTRATQLIRPRLKAGANVLLLGGRPRQKRRAGPASFGALREIGLPTPERNGPTTGLALPAVAPDSKPAGRVLARPAWSLQGGKGGIYPRSPASFKRNDRALGSARPGRPCVEARAVRGRLPSVPHDIAPASGDSTGVHFHGVSGETTQSLNSPQFKMLIA